ncbi:MAG: response regulator [Planctomycetota bacterium]|nr:MAG: response regulator [Planctomycetota bacterium]
MPHILIIDDDEDFAGAVQTVLESDGHRVHVELDLDSGYRHLADQTLPDVVILDVMFPENPSGGFELARKIRKAYPDLPILMLTAVNQEFPLGFSNKDIDPKWLPVADFISKPVDFDVLRTKVNELIDQKKAGTG